MVAKSAIIPHRGSALAKTQRLNGSGMPTGVMLKGVKRDEIRRRASL